MPQKNFWAGKRVLITGHTGFKGSWLALILAEREASLTGIGLEPPSQPSLFQAAKIDRIVDDRRVDIRDFGKLKSVIDEVRPDIILHLAAQSLVRPSYSDPISTYQTNVMGTVHVLEAARQSKCGRVIVNVTSDKCYENREWEWGYRETDAMGGYDPYSNSKGCAELVASAFRSSFFNSGEQRLVSVRAGNVIGGGDWALDRLIPDSMRAFNASEPVRIRNPHAQRPWQHVLEPLYGYLLVAEQAWNDERFADAWNFGPRDEDAKTVGYIVERLTRLWGKSAAWVDESGSDVNPHEAQYLKLDCSKAKARLGWTPSLNIESALKMTVDWYSAFYQGENVLNLTLAQIRSFHDVFTSLRNEVLHER